MKENKISDLLFANLEDLGWEKFTLQNYINKFPQNYWKMFDLDKMIIQANLLRK